jgi:4-alpha-glucanotransferase
MVKSLNTVTVIFKLPYYTQWGQSLIIAGSEPALGSWNVKQGLSLSPVHQGNALVWCGQVSVAAGFTSEYSYYVVDDHKNVLRWESGDKKKLVLPEGVQDGDVVEIRDWWQVKFACIH